MEVVEKMFDHHTLRRHRLSALANGVLVGIGIVFVLSGLFYGLVGIVAGVGLEFWHRSRIPKDDRY